MSPTRFADVNASNSAVFKETNFMSTVSRGSNGGPLETVDIKFVSLKTVLLLALTSAKRVGDMQALSVSPSCLQFSIAGDRVVMRPNAAYTPKWW